MTSALVEAMENEINQQRGVVKKLHDQLETEQRRASAAEAEVARLRAECEALIGVVDQSLSDVQGIMNMVDDRIVTDMLEHLADQLKSVLPETAVAVDALYDVTECEYGDDDSEAME